MDGYLSGENDVWVAVTGGRVQQIEPAIFQRLESNEFERYNYDRFYVYHYGMTGGSQHGITLDAEDSSSVVEPLLIDYRTDAGPYIWWPRPGPDGLTGQNGYAEFLLTVEEEESYSNWGLAPAENQGSDTFSVGVNGNKGVLWDLPDDNKWTWSLVPAVFDLDVGDHVILIMAVEKGAKLKQLRLIRFQ